MINPIVQDTRENTSSNQSFGLLFAIVFLLVAILPLLDQQPIRWWGIILSSIFAGLALFFPQLLTPLNRLWFKFGLALHYIITPTVMAILFFGVILPMGLLMGLLGHDPLRLKPSPGQTSYWIVRPPAKITLESMKLPF